MDSRTRPPHPEFSDAEFLYQCNMQWSYLNEREKELVRRLQRAMDQIFTLNTRNFNRDISTEKSA